MPRKTKIIPNQKEINEKISYRTKCNEWKELKVNGDILALAAITGKTPVTISKAVNHGTGSLALLRTVNDYYNIRKDVIPQTEYFTS